MPEVRGAKSFNEITVREGIDSEFLEEISDIGPDMAGALDRRLEARVQKQPIRIESDESHTTLTYGDIFFAELTLRRV